MGLKKYFGTMLSDGRVEIKIPDAWRVVLSKIVGRAPTVNQLDHETIAKNVRTGILYVLKESEAGEKEVVEIGGTGTSPDTHTRLHSMTDPLDHAAAAEADWGKAIGSNASNGAIEWFPRPENYWKRTGTTLSPATAGDKVEIIVTGTAVGLYVQSVNNSAINGYSENSNGGFFQSNTGVGAYVSSNENIALEVNAVNGPAVSAYSENNTAGIFVSENSTALTAESKFDGNIAFQSFSITAPSASFTRIDSGDPGVVKIIELKRVTADIGHDGIGCSLVYMLPNEEAIDTISAESACVMTDVSNGAEVSEINQYLLEKGELVLAYKLKATGEAKALGLYPFPQALFRQTADKTIANTTTETTLFGSGVGSRTIQANRMEAGSTIRLKIQGYLNTPASDEEATFKVKFGSTELISISGNLPQSLSEAAVVVDLLMTCRSAGATGKMMAAGVVLIEIRGAGYNAMIRLQTTSEVTVDTTSENDVDVTFRWTTAKVANQLITNVSLVELI